MFNRRIIPQTPKKVPTKDDNKCKITFKKVGNRIEKEISGSCTPAQLKALAEQHDMEKMEE